MVVDRAVGGPPQVQLVMEDDAPYDVGSSGTGGPGGATAAGCNRKKETCQNRVINEGGVPQGRVLGTLMF